VTVTQATTTFPDLPYDASATSVAPHVAFTVAQTGLACGDTLDFTFTINSNEGGPWADTFSLTVGQQVPGGNVNLFAESFDDATFPPAGWAQADVSGTAGNWARATATVHPSGQPPHSGAGLAYFNSWTATGGSSTRLYRTGSTAIPAGVPSAAVMFWMYHDTGYTADPDRVQVQVSTDGVAWTDLGTAVNRYDGSTGWKEHAIDASAYIGQSIYVGFLGISDYGNDCHIDDVALSYATPPQCNIYPCSSGPAFDMSFRDQYNRSELCLSSTTGDYIYNVLTGPHAGDSFTGVATITRYGTALYLFASPCTGGATHCVSGNWNTVRHTAATTLKTFPPVRYSQILSDANYLDSPPCAGP
jgi:hypothetical protein